MVLFTCNMLLLLMEAMSLKIIKANAFSCYYKINGERTKILKELDFDIQKGEIFVVVGESGGGKTTLLKCIAGLCNFLEGELIVDGVSQDDFDITSSNIGYVRQEYVLYPHMTVYENIAFPLRSMKTPQQEVDRRVKEIADALDIRWLLTRKPKQLSGGQHQRIAIARALVKKPNILLCDEPFSNLAPDMRFELRNVIRKINKVYGTTIVFVTHDLNEAFSLADRIMVLTDGRVEDIGTPELLRYRTKSELIKGYVAQ